MPIILIQLKKDFLLQNFFFPHFLFLDQLDDTADMKIRQGDQKIRKRLPKLSKSSPNSSPKHAKISATKLDLKVQNIYRSDHI
jgi:hypothetical protein